MSKLKDANKKIEKGVVESYKKIEEGVVDGYKKIEESVVGGYKKIEDKFVDKYLKKDGETNENAKYTANQGLWTLILAVVLCSVYSFFGFLNPMLHGVLSIIFNGFYAMVILIITLIYDNISIIKYSNL